MIDDDDIDMYDTDGFEPTERPFGDNGIKVLQKGMITELEIDGKKFNVVDPDYVMGLQKVVSELDAKLRHLDRSVKMMERRTTLQDRLISDLRSQLSGKIDRE